MRTVLAFAILLTPFSTSAASLTGALADPIGASIARTVVELDSGTRKYLTRTDDVGVYQFSELPAGEYTLTFRVRGFKTRIVKSIELSESEQRRVPDITLGGASSCSGGDETGPFAVELRPITDALGRLSGSVLPPVAGVEVTLICRTFSTCGSTRTDSIGHFTFEMLSSEVYGLSFRREGFYPESATGYAYIVNSGWESVYTPISLERCSSGKCDPKLRPPKAPTICE